MNNYDLQLTNKWHKQLFIRDLATSTQKGNRFLIPFGSFGDLVPERTNISPQDYCATQNKYFSRGEICVANVIPPANGASLGSFLCSKFRLG